MEIVNIILIILSGVFWLSGFYFLFRIHKCKNYDIENYPEISIIIPARNEEENIGKLLDSINSQSFKPNEVIVVNDHSTDKTKEISIDKGALVLDAQPLPKGWLGKPWACYQGANHAQSEILIFLDSDVEIEKDGLKKIVDTFLHSSKDNEIVMSVAPFHKVQKIYEDLSAIFNIIMTGSMNAFTPLKNNEPTGLFGQSLILKKSTYFSIKGHESVKDKILENVFMAEIFSERGIKLKCYGGCESLSFRMYPVGLKDLINGWTKAFASGAGKTATPILLNIIFWISAGFMIPIALVNSIIFNENVFLWIAFYFAYAIQMLWLMRRIGNFKLITAVLFPVNLIFYCIVFFRSLYFQLTKRKVQWKAREI